MNTPRQAGLSPTRPASFRYHSTTQSSNLVGFGLDGCRALAGGQADQAMLHLRRVCRIWAEIDLPLELARTRLLLSAAYSALVNTDEGELEERTARAVMDRIGTGALRRELMTPN